MLRPWKHAVLMGLVLVALIWLANGHGSAAPHPQAENSLLRYTDDGRLIFPEGHRTWILAGADLGIEYGDAAKIEAGEKPAAVDELASFHNVYINRLAYETYEKSHAFPDGTVLVMEVFESLRKEPRHIVSKGRYQGKRSSVEVAVKNSKRPDGSNTPWAYYNFTDPARPSGPPLKAARAHADSSCYDCHKKHADVDNVWVQFYPTLRDVHGEPVQQK